MQVAATNDANAAIDADGCVLLWGGSLANLLLEAPPHVLGGVRRDPAPLRPLRGRAVRSISLGGSIATAVTADGEVWLWTLSSLASVAGTVRRRFIEWSRLELPGDAAAGAGGEEGGEADEPDEGPVLRPGRRVTLCGLQVRADLNGAVGRLQAFDSPSGRWAVALDGAASVRIKPINLTPVTPAAESGEASSSPQRCAVGLASACGSEHALVLCASLPSAR